MTWRAIASVCAAVAVGCAFTSQALAHDTPHVLDIAIRETGYVLLTNRGLIFGDKQRSNWRLMCAEALGINTTEEPSLVATIDGGLLVGTSKRLSHTTDDGCLWQPIAPFEDTSIPAMVADPTNSNRIYLAAYSSDAAAMLGGLYLSTDSGSHWQKLLAAGERDYVRSIRVAPSDPQRIFAAGQTWDAAGKYSYYLSQSRDGGKTWDRQPVSLEAQERELVLFQVSPRDPQLITLRVGNSSPMTVPERLLVSRDGGKTFENPISLLLLSELAFSADGGKAWVVGQEGLFESTDDLVTFNRVGAAESMSYVAERDGQILACGFYNGYAKRDNGVGMAPSTASEFSSFMQLLDVTMPVACDPASATAIACAPWWLDWQREMRLGQLSAAGGAAAGGGGISGSGPSTGVGDVDGGSVAGGAGGSAAGAGVRAGTVAVSGTGAEAHSSSAGGCAVLERGRDRSSGPFAACALSLMALLLICCRRARLRRQQSRLAQRT